MSTKIPYGFSTEIEQQLACRLSKDPKLCGSLLGALDIERIQDSTAALVLRCVWTINKELGHGPSAYATVTQRLLRLNTEGSLTAEQLNLVQEMFADVDTHTPPEAEFLNEVVPIIRRRAQGDIVGEMALAHGNKADVLSLSTKLQQTAGIGLVDRSIGEELTASSLVSLTEESRELLPFGIEELDLVIEGGIARGCVCLILAPTSGGKSMFMCHHVCTALRRGYNVAVATLELSAQRWQARVLSNLTGVPSNAILDGTADGLALEKFKKLAPNLGRFFPKKFPTDVTTLEDILTWVKEVEKVRGAEIHFVVIDYLGKLNHDTGPARGKADHIQRGMTLDRFRDWVADHSKWGETGAQAKRGNDKDKKTKLSTDDTGDSLKLAQNTDYMVSMVKNDDNTEATFHVAKQRNGAGEKQTIGPLPVNFACGRVAPLFNIDD